MKASDFLKKLKEIDLSRLSEIKGLGDVLIENFNTFLDSNRYKKMVVNFEKLESEGIALNIISKKSHLKNQSEVLIGPGKLVGQKICITGTFEISREKIKENLENLGAVVVNTISKSTTILLAGGKAGSKVSNAEKLGVKIVYDLGEIY